MDILFLDDDITRVEEFQKRTGLKVHHVKNGKEFVAAINDKHYDAIFLDHDLGLDDWTGTNAAKYLAQNRSLVGDEQTVIIHSANPVGIKNMMGYMGYCDHLQVFTVWFAWSRVSYEDGRLKFTI